MTSFLGSTGINFLQAGISGRFHSGHANSRRLRWGRQHTAMILVLPSRVNHYETQSLRPTARDIQDNSPQVGVSTNVSLICDINITHEHIYVVLGFDCFCHHNNEPRKHKYFRNDYILAYRWQINCIWKIQSTNGFPPLALSRIHVCDEPVTNLFLSLIVSTFRIELLLSELHFIGAPADRPCNPSTWCAVLKMAAYRPITVLTANHFKRQHSKLHRSRQYIVVQWDIKLKLKLTIWSGHLDGHPREPLLSALGL